MSFCMNCGQQLDDKAKFCSNCGKEVGIAQNEVNSQRKTIYEGELHKCPNCGEILNSFVLNCPSCGYELRGSHAINSVRELAYKLETIENSREEIKTYSIVGKLYGSDGKLGKTDEQKISLIRNFSIPNTKEDILEFIILAASNIDLKLYGLGNQGVITASQRAVSDAWLAKFEQAYQKAQVAFGVTPEFLNIREIYDGKMKELKRKKLQIPMLVVGIIMIAIFPWILVLLFS